MKKVLTILLAILLSFAVGCTLQEDVIDPPAQVTETDQDAADKTGYVEPPADSEIGWPTYTSVEEMIQAIQAEYKDDMERLGKVGELSTIYVPPQTLGGRSLNHIAVSPNDVCYYYMPRGTAGSDFSYYFSSSDGILVTHYRELEYDPDTFFADNHLFPDEDGFVYKANKNEMTFIQDGGIISVQVPDILNDYETLRKLCRVKRIEITEDALAEASWEIDEVEETDAEITKDAQAIATWEIDAEEKMPLYSSVETLVQSGYFESLTTVYTPPSEIEGFCLRNIELLPHGMIYYYDPGEVPLDHFSWSQGITYTIHQNSTITMESICAQNELLPDEDGYAYDTEGCEIHFEQDGIAVSVHVPEHMNDYDTLRSLCRMEKVMVP